MKDFICLALFAVCWVTFCKFGLYIYDKICYLILDYVIENGEERHQIKISNIFGAD